jgi:hypothetical protein
VAELMADGQALTRSLLGSGNGSDAIHNVGQPHPGNPPWAARGQR